MVDAVGTASTASEPELAPIAISDEHCFAYQTPPVGVIRTFRFIHWVAALAQVGREMFTRPVCG
jgi:hypothetical protein